MINMKIVIILMAILVPASVLPVFSERVSVKNKK